MDQKQNQLEQKQFIGPNPRKIQKVQLHDLVLDNLPSAQNYELSYMHRDNITNVLASIKQDIIVTISSDGHIKFWKKVFNLIQFVKNFKAHNGLITSATFNKDHDLFASVGIDKTIKIFDVLNCDLRSVVKLNFSPYCCEFIPQKEFDWQLLAISEDKTGRIIIIDPNTSHKNNFIQEDQQVIQGNVQKVVQNLEQTKKESQLAYLVLQTLNFHKHPIKFIKMDWIHNICFSIDQRSFLQIWDPQTFDFPTNMKYKCKIQTQFLKLLASNSIPFNLNISPKGSYLAIPLKDRSIKVFNIISGKLIANINQPFTDIISTQQGQNSLFHLDQHQFERKLALQKDLQTSKDNLYSPNVQFDETQEFIIYSSFYGIKFYSLTSKIVQRIIGTKEHERYVKIALFQGRVMRNPAGSSNAKGERKGTDPTLYISAFRKGRFYIYSRRQPELSEGGNIRDIINEKPNKQELMIQKMKQAAMKESEVVLQTTMGDIHIELFVDDCPKTTQNFLKLTKKGYYDGMIFHRVIKGFMNQTGCPKGDGTGGQSIWGGNFQDQLRPQKHRFDKPYLVAMANRGPNTNGSQFFITVVQCPWLDNKHTIFGRISKGISVVCEINKLKTDKGDKPLNAVKIMSARIVK